MIENFGKHPVFLEAGQTVAQCDEHATDLVGSNISHSKLFCILQPDAKWRKRDFRAKDVDLINNYLDGSRNASVDQSEEVRIMAENVKLHV